MSYPFFDKVQDLSIFWKKHRYCLPAGSLERGIRLLATSSNEFQTRYSYFYITKILHSFCYFENEIQTKEKPKLLFRLFKPAYESGTLGIAVVIRINRTEFLSKEHFLRAISHILPGVVALPQFNYQYRDEEQGLLFIYQEIEKKKGRGFLSPDVWLLKKFLAKELEESIATYAPSLFLIRNEEEIFRSIVQMSRELTTPHDMPQVTISFQEQMPRGFLRFSVVVVRLVNSPVPSLRQLSLSLPQTIQFIHEMTSEVGTIDAETSKEANMVTFEVASSLFSRKNGSIDLREARSYVARALELILGDFRDYNGGLFSKQNKHLKEIQETLSDANKMLFESIFYSFTPSLFQTFLLPEAGKACASLFAEAANNHLLPPQKNYSLFKHHERTFSVIVIRTPNEHLKIAIAKEIAAHSFPLHQFGYSAQRINGEYYLVLIHQYPQDTSWFDAIEELLQHFQHLTKQERNFLRINFQDGDPLSLHPQIGVDLRCRSVQKALFEGLTRINAQGVVELAAAKKVDISEDGKTYLFTLRKLQWSNGEELTAMQFEKSWKNALKSPSCLRPDIFYILKNAKQSRFDQLRLEEIGVRALDKTTLQVTLEYPAPYFLQMLAHPWFFPLYEDSGEPYVFSGPFTLHSWKRDSTLLLIKNPYYWDFENVKLDGIEISVIHDPHLAFQKYENGELDWIGGPFSLLPPSIASRIDKELQVVNTPGVAWLYCNLNQPSLSSSKIRRALSYALDREEICKKSSLNPIPLKTQLPTGLSLLDAQEIYSEQNTIELFEEGLEEMKCSRKTFDDLMLYHSHIPGQKELAHAIQQQWQEKFDIKIQRVEETWNTFTHQLDKRRIHFGSCYRHPFYYDAMYFFQIFCESSNIHNAFGWHSESFNRWIHLASNSSDKNSYLKMAEKELLHQMPVIPIHMVTYNYLARNGLRGIHFSHSGDVDFKWIYFEEPT